MLLSTYARITSNPRPNHQLRCYCPHMLASHPTPVQIISSSYPSRKPSLLLPSRGIRSSPTTHHQPFTLIILTISILLFLASLHFTFHLITLIHPRQPIRRLLQRENLPSILLEPSMPLP